MVVHGQQGALHRAGVAQDRHEQVARLGQGTQRLFQMAARVAQLTQRGGIDTFDLRIARHGVEQA